MLKLEMILTSLDKHTIRNKKLHSYVWSAMVYEDPMYSGLLFPLEKFVEYWSDYDRDSIINSLNNNCALVEIPFSERNAVFSVWITHRDKHELAIPETILLSQYVTTLYAKYRKLMTMLHDV